MRECFPGGRWGKRGHRSRAAAAGRAWALALLILGLCAPMADGVLPSPRTNSSGQLVPPVLPLVTNRAPARIAPPTAAEPDFSERNQSQRSWLLALMAGLLVAAWWYKGRSATKVPEIFPGRGGRIPAKPRNFKP